MSEERPPGRLLLVTGAPGTDRTTVAYAVAARLPRAVHVDAQAVHEMVVSGAVPMPEWMTEPTSEPAPPEAVEQLFLRWLAGIAVAETYQRAGFDAVISDEVPGDFLDDLLDFVSPAPLHLVVLDPAAAARLGAADGGPRGVGLRLDPGALGPEATADAVLARLDEALVDTATA